MPVEIKLTSRIIVPQAMVARLSLSCPYASRLNQCHQWASLDRERLEAALREAGCGLDRLRPAEFQQTVDALSRKLKTLATDPVWLVPECVGSKPAYADHMRPHLSSSARTVLAFGLRDTYQNLFKFIWQRNQHPSLLCRPIEPLEKRQYAALYARTAEPGRLRGGLAAIKPDQLVIAGDSSEVEFAIVATPLVENSRITPLERRIGFQSDLRHEFRINPRSGGKPDLPALQQYLLADESVEATGERILQEATRRGLPAQDGYYLSSVGVRDNGDLILISQHSSVSALAEAQLHAGATHALLVEEGGSCGTAIWQNALEFSLPDYVKRDANGNPIWQPEPVIFGTNSYFRPFAIATCVVELNEFFLEAPFVP